MATILVLDDRAVNREFLVALLNYAGHTLLEAADAEGALGIARAVRLDLVIADMLMPVIDGFGFVRRLRAEPALAHIRVIFYTATYIEAEARALARTVGVMHLLSKPSEPKAILKTVETALRMEVPSLPPAEDQVFENEHQRLLLDKLAQKVDELELLNSTLEARVAERTAELAEANTHLRELNAFKDNLLVIASHDLRSPLGAIQTMAELMMDEDGLSTTNRSMAQNIYDSARHLTDMVSKMLDLSRLEAGRVELDPIELCASAVVRQVFENLRWSASAKTITLQLNVEPDEPVLLADWMKLSQIITNLISNAIKFTAAGGDIQVTVGTEPNGVGISVADTGLGIPNDALPSLFGKFRQIHLRGTANERGSGLGLAITQQLVALHGGTIEVTSKVNRGSVFTVHLPLKPSNVLRVVGEQAQEQPY